MGTRAKGSQCGTGDGDRGGFVEVARYRGLASQANQRAPHGETWPHYLVAVGRVRTAVRQLERAGMILGAVATGVELVREIRFASSNGAPSRGRDPRAFIAVPFGREGIRAFIRGPNQPGPRKRPHCLEESTWEPHRRNGAVPAQGAKGRR